MPANRTKLPSLAFALAFAAVFAAPPAFADSMKTDSMKSTDTMQTQKMENDDCMGKAMTKKEKADCEESMKTGDMMKTDDSMMKSTDTMKPAEPTNN